MITNNMSIILYITGAITASMLLQFLFPRTFLRLANKVELEDKAGLFYARHWGMMVFVLGALMVYVGYYPAGQTPVLLAVTVEKVAFVAMVFTSLDEPLSRALIPSALFDSTCVILFTLSLTGLA
ncbi:MAG: hypothetical protein CL920_00900 [Deltaproteobacteria bacterium]|nr:hypothetical protein [Deltaproteobacteria bacterium]MBU47238.1 hypothetical protein [Deltaproteobacteria bacterium]